MDAEVDQRSAAGGFPLEEPAAGLVGVQPGDAAPPEPDAAAIINIAERSGIDHGLHRLRLRGETVAEIDPELAFAAAGGLQHAFGFHGVQRHRFFAQYMRSGAQRGERQRTMQKIRHRDRNDIQLFLLDHFKAVAVAAADAEFGVRPVEFFRLGVGGGGELHRRVFGESAEVAPAHSQADDADFQFFGHD
ncbi:hypothetical protein SDC9_181882 [bioreactor metagenome]|uniref:Uncharacterized protein n=1 Tax=bioreactor metagenome TaxID=1076179 RepID=A0A645H8H2_9ZZZZ